jgi:putative ABC transport system permease protein
MPMDALIQDLRYAGRTLRRSPGFTIVAVLTLALGIGANTAIFSVLYAALLRPLPYPDPGRLMGLSVLDGGSRYERSVDWREYRFLDENSRVFESLAVSTNLGFNVFTGGEADRARGMRVSSGFFHALGVSPLLGRAFSPDDDRLGGPNVAMLSYGYWRRRFGGDRSIVGRAITLDGAPYTVVGVMPSGFQTQPQADVWSTVGQVSRTVGSGANLRLTGRLKAGLSPARAGAEFASTAAAFKEAFSGRISPDARLELHPQRQLIVSDLRTPLQVLFGAIGFVLLIACANVAGLLLGRAAGRGRELAVRVALGASRGRVIRQLLTESVLLSLIGGAVALLLARWGLDALLTFVPADIKAMGVRLDWWAIGFTFALSLASGVVFGLLPAWQASRPDVHEGLKEGSGRTTAAVGHGRMRDALAVAEIALSLVLLVGAGLLIRTVGNLLRTDPGFDPRHVLSAEIWLNGTGYDSSAAIAGFYHRLTSRVELLPGVRSAAVVEAGLPLERGGNQYVTIEGRADGASVDYRTVTPGYFRTLGIPLARGRAFGAGDVEGADPVAVVNESFARRYLADRVAVGRTVSFDGGRRPPRRIVGVVGDVRSFIGSPARPTVFLPSAQTPAGYTRIFGSWFPIHVVVSAAGDPAAMVVGVTRAIHDTDPRVPVGRVRPLEEVLSQSVAESRFQMLLLSVFAGLALVLAAVGIYGVMSYLVAQRRHEIGVRLALGAVPREVLRLVLRRGLGLALTGAALGLLGSVALTRLLGGFLYGISPADPATYAAVTALLLLVALAACFIPARRAARVDPVVALRSE